MNGVGILAILLAVEAVLVPLVALLFQAPLFAKPLLTGTLLLLSSPAHPKKTALLPESHIAVVSAARLVPTMEAAFALLRMERGELPRATWFVSGASRTADIEQTLVIGAHGPYRAHVIIIP